MKLHQNRRNTVFPRDMVCLRNISVDTLHKGDTEDIITIIIIIIIPERRGPVLRPKCVGPQKDSNPNTILELFQQ